MVQPLVALSTTESEYMAVAEVDKEALCRIGQGAGYSARWSSAAF